MIISVINMTDRDLDDAALQAGIRAVNRQLTYDFAPYWGFGAQLRLEGKTGRRQGFDQADMRGDAVLYVRKRRGDDDDGFHTRTRPRIATCSTGSRCAMRFRARPTRSTARTSVGVNPGGYINFFDPKLEGGGADDEFAHPDDKVAEKRLAMKRSIGVGRGHRRRLQGGAEAARV